MFLLENKKSLDQKGLTLIEVSVILSVLAILSAFLVPAVSHFLQDASMLQAQNDVKVIASGLINFMNDTGQSPAMLGSCQPEFGNDSLIVVLAGPGRQPQTNQGRAPGKPRLRSSAAARRFHALSSDSTAGWLDERAGALEDFLQWNACELPLKRAGIGFGWNGPYINNQLGPDPWGNRYLVNVGFLDTQAGAGDAEGEARGAVFVLSAGPNQIIETPFSQPVSDALVYGDDIVARIR